MVRIFRLGGAPARGDVEAGRPMDREEGEPAI